MDALHWNGDVDDREFGAPTDICERCGADLVDDGHEPSCEWHPDFYEPRGVEVEVGGSGDE